MFLKPKHSKSRGSALNELEVLFIIEKNNPQNNQVPRSPKGRGGGKDGTSERIHKSHCNGPGTDVPAFSPPGKAQHHNGNEGPRVKADRMQLTWRRRALSGTYNTCSFPAPASLGPSCQKINKPDQTCHGLEVFSYPFILTWCSMVWFHSA